MKKSACALFFFTCPSHSHVSPAGETSEAGSRKFSFDGMRIIRDDMNHDENATRVHHLHTLLSYNPKYVWNIRQAYTHMNAFITHSENTDEMIQEWRASLLHEERERRQSDRRRSYNPLYREESIKEDFSHAD